MGKIPPLMRSAPLPLSFLRPSSPSPTAPKPRPPLFKTSSKQRKVFKRIENGHSVDSSSAMPSSSPLINSPDLSQAIAVVDSSVSSDGDAHSLLQSFCNSGASSGDSLALLRHISLRFPSFSPTRSTHHILLVHSCLQPITGDLSPIITSLNLMSSSGFPPDPSSADLAVRALCSASREDDAASLLLRLPSLRPDPFTYNFLIGRLAKIRSISAVYSFIDELRTMAEILPDRITYTILIDSVCRSRNLREATRLLGVLKHSGIKPDCYLYNTIMKAYCMLDQCGEIMEFYNKMKDDGIEPDIVTYNTLVYGLSKVGMIDQAKKFLNVMATTGIFPDVATYTSLISGMCRKGDAMGALRMLGEMEEKGCSPNDFTYNSLLMGLCKAGRLDKGMELYKMMAGGAMKLESSAYATFLRKLCRENKVAEAFEAFDYVRESRSMAEETAYLVLENSLKRIK